MRLGCMHILGIATPSNTEGLSKQGVSRFEAAMISFHHDGRQQTSAFVRRGVQPLQGMKLKAAPSNCLTFRNSILSAGVQARFWDSSESTGGQITISRLALRSPTQIGLLVPYHGGNVGMVAITDALFVADNGVTPSTSFGKMKL